MSQVISVKNLCYHFEENSVLLKIYNTEWIPLVERCKKTKSKSCFITLSDDRRMRIQLIGDELLYYKHPDWGLVQLVAIDLQKQYERQIEEMKIELAESEAVERFLVSCNDPDERTKAHYRQGKIFVSKQDSDVSTWVNSSSSDDSSN